MLSRGAKRRGKVGAMGFEEGVCARSKQHCSWDLESMTGLHVRWRRRCDRDDRKRVLRRLKSCCEAFGGGRRARICGNVGHFGGPNGVEMDAVYRADSFCRRFLGFQGGQDGRKALAQSAHGGCIPRRSAGRRNLGLCGRSKWVQFGAFWEVKWGLFGVQNGYVGPFREPNWVEKTPVDAGSARPGEKKKAAARRFPSCSIPVCSQMGLAARGWWRSAVGSCEEYVARVTLCRWGVQQSH